MRLAEGNIAAMDASDVTGNRKSEPGRAGVLIARVVDAVERAEHLLAFVLGNARAVIIDFDGESAVLPRSAHPHMLGEARGVVDEVGDRALEGVPLDRHHERRILDVDGNVTGAMCLGFYVAQ